MPSITSTESRTSVVGISLLVGDRHTLNEMSHRACTFLREALADAGSHEDNKAQTSCTVSDV